MSGMPTVQVPQLPPSTPLHSTPLHSTPLHSTPLHSTPLHSTPLHLTPLLTTSTSHTHRPVGLLLPPPHYKSHRGCAYALLFTVMRRSFVLILVLAASSLAAADYPVPVYTHHGTVRRPTATCCAHILFHPLSCCAPIAPSTALRVALYIPWC